MKPIEKSYIEEFIRVIRPSNDSHIFDEVSNDKIADTYDSDGIRTVFLRKKES